jgi:hypothetical protein
VKAVAPVWTEAAIRRYLLGLLPEPEAEALEEAYLGDPEVLARVRGVEDDLLDDYAAGRLTKDEIGHFESRYLPSPYLRRRVTAARALRLAAGEDRAAVPRAAPAPRFRWRGPLAIAAAVLMAVAVAMALRSPRPAAVATASVPPTTLAMAPPSVPPATPSPEATTVASTASTSPTVTPAAIRIVVALSPVLLRGANGPVELRVARRTAAVVLELQGDPAVLAPRPGAALGATIETVEGASVWRGDARLVRGRPPVLASVEVPADRLGTGDYLVTLSRAEEVLYRYSFRVPAR